MSFRSTKKQYVYLITNEAWPGWVKVGITEDLKKRISQYQTSSPHRDYKIEYSYESDDARRIETLLKETLKPFISKSRHEWYQVNLDLCRDQVEILLEATATRATAT